MELKSGQIWALEDNSENTIEVLDVAKVNDNGTFTGGFHAVGNPSDFVWREEVPKEEILDNKLWKLVGALDVVDILARLANWRNFFSKKIEEKGTRGKGERECWM